MSISIFHRAQIGTGRVVDQPGDDRLALGDLSRLSVGLTTTGSFSEASAEQLVL
jgi:hypothetical protein